MTLEEKQAQMRDRSAARHKRAITTAARNRAPHGPFKKHFDEVDVVQDLADGLTVAEIASKYKVSYHTVKLRLRYGRKRHSAKTNHHLVAILVADELVMPSEFGDIRQ